MSIAALAAAAKDNDRKFEVAPAASYRAHQTSQKVTIAADVFVSEEKSKPAFGKSNPYENGVLPVLVVIQNDSGKALNLQNMRVEYVTSREKVRATPAAEVKYIRGAQRPNVMEGPTGKPKILKRKNPLQAWEIEGRAFAAKMLPPGESASGFVYFQTGFQKSANLYLTGIREADTGNELFYFEIPLADADGPSPSR